MNFFEGEDTNEMCPTMSFQQRVYGFVSCLVLGGVMGIFSWVCAFRAEWNLFAIFMTMSNVISISGSMFFAGPVKQVKKMFAETRWIATSVFIIAMLLTILSAVLLKKPALVVVMCLIQYVAMVWYGLSYIPYARTVVKNCFQSLV